MTGALESRVERNAAGGLDFYYRLTNLVQNTPVVSQTFPVALVHGVSLQGCGGLGTDVYEVTGAGGVGPGAVRRDGTGSTLVAEWVEVPNTYPYSYTLHAGADTTEVLVRTNATSFQVASLLVSGSVFDARYPSSPSGAFGAVSALVPGGAVYPVPEPGAAALLSVAVGGLLVRLGRRG
jgi:hypothetical protein